MNDVKVIWTLEECKNVIVVSCGEIRKALFCALEHFEGDSDKLSEWLATFMTDVKLTASLRKELVSEWKKLSKELGKEVSSRKIAKALNVAHETVSRDLEEISGSNEPVPETPTAATITEKTPKINQIKHIGIGYGKVRKHMQLNTKDALVLRGGKARDVGNRIPNDELGEKLKTSMVNKYPLTEQGLFDAEQFINENIENESKPKSEPEVKVKAEPKTKSRPRMPEFNLEDAMNEHAEKNYQKVADDYFAGKYRKTILPLCVRIIEKGYTQLAMKLHPDKKGGSKEEFQELQKAYEFFNLTFILDEDAWSKENDEKGGENDVGKDGDI